MSNSNRLPDSVIRDRLRLQNMAMQSPSEFPVSQQAGQKSLPRTGMESSLAEPSSSPMTELAMNFGDTTLDSTPVQDNRRRLILDSADSPDPVAAAAAKKAAGNTTPVSRNPGSGGPKRNLGSMLTSSATSSKYESPKKRKLMDEWNKENLLVSSTQSSSKNSQMMKNSSPLLKARSPLKGVENIPKPLLAPFQPFEDEDTSSQDSGFCSSITNSQSIRRTSLELRFLAEDEPLPTLPEGLSPEPKADLVTTEQQSPEPKAHFQIDELEEEGEEDGDVLPTDSISSLIGNKFMDSPPSTSQQSQQQIIVQQQQRSEKRRLDFDQSTNSKRPNLRRCTSLLESNMLNPEPKKMLLESPPERFKRPIAPTEDTTPVNTKRRRFDEQEERPKLRRSVSEVVQPSATAAATIMRACSRADSNQDLTGDMVRSHALPCLQSGLKHPNLKTITSETLADLLQGKYEDSVESFRIIDARYSYEFKGGHIIHAENFGSWDEKQFFDEFLPEAKPPCEPIHETDDSGEAKGKSKIVIFHCEFSSARGPELMKKLRSRDRLRNKDVYPALYYPELYLLHNGYKEFFEKFPHLCQPRGYLPMKDPRYAKEERAFRAKSKSWAGGTVARTGTSSRLLKL